MPPPEPARQMLLTPLTEMTSHPTDPVEMRRMNFQTQALMNHQPIAVSDLSAHIDNLKNNEGLSFSQVCIDDVTYSVASE